MQCMFPYGLGCVPSTHSMHNTQVGSSLSFFGDHGPCFYQGRASACAASQAASSRQRVQPEDVVAARGHASVVAAAWGGWVGRNAHAQAGVWGGWVGSSAQGHVYWAHTCTRDTGIWS